MFIEVGLFEPEPPEDPLDQFDPKQKERIQNAAKDLKNSFFNIRGAPIRTPYFLKQLQVLYETYHYSWVVADALRLMESQNVIRSFTTKNLQNTSRLKHLPSIKFYANSMIMNSEVESRRVRTKAYGICKLINDYSDPEITKNVGRHLENLVREEIRAQDFKIIGRNTNEYNGKKWTTSKRDLDFIAEHKSGKLVIGVEVKNTLDIIPKEELLDKLKICEFLGITPVFAVRWDKPYAYEVHLRGGFSWMFKTQIYPETYRRLVERIYRKLSATKRKGTGRYEMKFPVKDRSTLPEKTVQVFQLWVSNTVGLSE